MKRLDLLLFIAFLLLAFTARADYQGENPYEPKRDQYDCDLLVVGGSSSGTAAAITAGRLGIRTVWTLRAPRDLGGLSTNAVNPDSDLPIRYIGGLALELDTVARYTTGFHVGGRHNGEGFFAPFHVFFRYARAEVDRLPSLAVLSNLYPIAVEKDPATRRVAAVTFGHRLAKGRRIVVRLKITIDAEIEGDVAWLAGVSMTLCREGRVPSNDPTRNQESYAGRIFTPEKKIWSLIVAGGRLMEGSTQQPDRRGATMAWNGSVSLEDYGAGTPQSPWVLKRPPRGYDPAEFAWWTKGVFGVGLGDNHRRWNIDQYLSTVEGWRMPDGRHVLESMDIADREANEKEHLAHVIRGLWHLQHSRKEYRYGLSQLDFREGLAAKYRLSDFGTTTNAGDAPLPGLIYMREGRRMVNDHVFGGRLIEDDGTGRYLQKRHWHPRSVYYNAMLVDIHGVHRERRPGSGPEGMQLLRLAGFHNFGAPCIPLDVLLPRPTEATGLLVSSAGAYTHQAYAAFPRMETGRIAQGHAAAVAAWHALGDRVAPHQVDVRKVQISNALLNGQSIVYLDDTLPGTSWHVVDQMLGARRVPERNDQGVFQSDERVAAAEMRSYLERLFRDYAEQPVAPRRLSAALERLPREPQTAVTRRQALEALSLAAGLGPGKAAGAPFADVPAGSDLAAVLTPWIARKWIAADGRHRFRPEEPIPFSQFKRHAYHALFADVAPQTVRAVDYRPRLAWDAFNRRDGPIAALASGQQSRGTGRWAIEAGNLRAKEIAGTTYFLVDAGRTDVDVAVDLLLEQTKNPAAAGLVIGASDARNMHRFLIQAEGPAIRIRADVMTDGRIENWFDRSRATHRRGFPLRVLVRGDRLECYLDEQLVCSRRLREGVRGPLVGLLNGGGEASRLDNLEVRTAE